MTSGQSFVKKGSTGKWKDQYGKTVTSGNKTYSLGNIRIKAYTDDVRDGSYNIVFSGGDNEAVTGTMNTLTVARDVRRALPFNGFALANYYFAGWKTEGGDIYSDGQVVSNLAESGSAITLTATWKPTIYSITYENIDMDGVYAPANPTSYTALLSDITLKNPTRTGYTFLGWYESEDFDESSKVTKIVTSEGGNYILYAKWMRVASGLSDAPRILIDMTNRPTFILSRSEGKKGLKLNTEHGYDPVDTSSWNALDKTVISGMVEEEIYFYQSDMKLYAAIADGVDAAALPNGTYRFEVKPVTLRHLSELVLMNPIPVTVIVVD